MSTYQYQIPTFKGYQNDDIIRRLEKYFYEGLGLGLAFKIKPFTTAEHACNWNYGIGTNTMPRDGKRPIIKYKEYRNKRIPQKLFNDWIESGKFNNLCCMIGKLSGHTGILNYARKGLYLNFADFDNELAIKEFCEYKGRQFTLQQMAEVCYIVQHSDDPTHCHVYWISSKPMSKRTIDKDKKILEQIRNNKLPSVEIKGVGDVAFCSGGYHESGNQYLPIGTTELCIIEELGEHIEDICRKYNLPVSDTERNKNRRLVLGNAAKKQHYSSTKTLYDYESEEWSDIHESSRNNTIFDKSRKYYQKNKDLLSDNSFRKIVNSWNQKYCKPPLDPFEIDSICNSILNHHSNNGSSN